MPWALLRQANCLFLCTVLVWGRQESEQVGGIQTPTMDGAPGCAVGARP